MKTVGSCVIYLRVSTAEQSERGSSRVMQESRARAWAESCGRDVHMVFEDEGVSGKDMHHRPEVLKAIAMAKDLRCPLVVYSLSRLGRNLRDLLRTMDELQKAGSDLVSLTESIDTTNAAGRMMFRMLAVLAEFERDLLIERTNAVLADKRARGESTGVPAYGWRSVDGMLVADDDEQAAVMDMVRLRKAGASYRGIAATLSDMGVPTRDGTGPGKPVTSKGHGVWGESTVRKILWRIA